LNPAWSANESSRPPCAWAIDLTRAVRALQGDAYIIHCDDLAQLSPYQTRQQRFGDYTLSLIPPEPFGAELLMPFRLDEQPETVVVA
jgi:hypothetical protein